MVMKASPTSSLEVPEPELLLEFLVIPLDAPAQLRERDEAVEGDVFRKGRKPELRGLLLLSWPFDEEPFLVTGNASIEVPVRGANTDTREARDQDVGTSLAPGDHLPGLGRKRKRETLDGLGLVVGVADHAARRAPTPGPGPDRRGRVGARPHGGVRLDAGDVSKTEPREGRTQAGFGAVAGVHQDHAGRGAGLERSPDLVECDLGLRPERHLLRHARFLPASRISGPVLRQVEPIGDREARAGVREGQGHCDLAVVLLAELPRVLPSDAHRVLALLWKARDSAPLTGPSWRMAGPIGCPLAASHRRRVLS